MKELEAQLKSFPSHNKNDLLPDEIPFETWKWMRKVNQVDVGDSLKPIKADAGFHLIQNTMHNALMARTLSRTLE